MKAKPESFGGIKGHVIRTWTTGVKDVDSRCVVDKFDKHETRAMT